MAEGVCSVWGVREGNKWGRGGGGGGCDGCRMAKNDEERKRAREARASGARRDCFPKVDRGADKRVERRKASTLVDGEIFAWG